MMSSRTVLEGLRSAVPWTAAIYLAAILWILAQQGVRAVDVTAGIAVATALASFAWGTWRWAGFLAWIARFGSWLFLLAAAMFGIQVVMATLPFLLLSLPLIWPGSRGTDGRLAWWG